MASSTTKQPSNMLKWVILALMSVAVAGSGRALPAGAVQRVVHARGRSLLAPLQIDTDDPVYLPDAFTNFTDIQGMADAMKATKGGKFEYVLEVSNSVARAMREGYGKEVADAFRLMAEQTNWDVYLVYPMGGVFRKAMFDNLVLDQNPEAIYDVIDYMLGPLQKPDDPQRPFGGAPASYAYSILYLMDRNASDLAGKLFAISTVKGGQTLSTSLEAINVAVLSQGCSVVWPVLKATESYLSSWGVPGQMANVSAAYPGIMECTALPAAANLPSQVNNTAFAKDLKSEDWSPQAVEWAIGILEGTPLGAGNASAATYAEFVYNQTRYFGNFEQAATALAVTLIQEGPVADTMLRTLEQVMHEVGCQPISKSLVDAQGLARAMGTSGTFDRVVTSSPRVDGCLAKGLLAYQYDA